MAENDRFENPSPDLRALPARPVVGVGAVILRPGQVLLIRRGKPPLEGTWTLPGGHQDFGEAVIDAVHREVAEETGVAIRILGLVDVIDLIGREADDRVAWHYTVVDMAAAWDGGEPCCGSDAADVGWFDIDDLAELGLTAETERVIGQARKMWPDVAG